MSDEQTRTEPLMEALELAWGLIANASNWDLEGPAIGTESLPSSLFDTDEITWGLDDEDEYQIVAMREYVEPSVDDVY